MDSFAFSLSWAFFKPNLDQNRFQKKNKNNQPKNSFQTLKNNLSTVLLKAIYLENGPVQS